MLFGQASSFAKMYGPVTSLLFLFLNDVDIQLILEFNSFGKKCPVFPKHL